MGLKNTELHILQNQEDSKVIQDIQELKKSYGEHLELINAKEIALQDKDATIKELQTIIQNNSFPLEQISEEAKVNYSEIQSLSFAKKITYNFEKTDTITVISTHWKSDNKKSKEQFDRFKTWLKTRLETDKIEVVRE